MSGFMLRPISELPSRLHDQVKRMEAAGQADGVFLVEAATVLDRSGVQRHHDRLHSEPRNEIGRAKRGFSDTDVVLESKKIQQNKREEAGQVPVLNGTQVVDANNLPLKVFHGSTAAIDLFDIAKTVDGGLHFGTADQANMRVAGAGKNLSPVYLNIKRLRRSKDTGGNWRAKILAAKAAGFDGIVYLNRYEGMTTERIVALSESGKLAGLDALTDRQFKELVPEARDSYIAFDPGQVVSIFSAEQITPKALPVLTHREESTACYSGQTNMTMTAFMGSDAAGRIDYVIYNDTISISLIEVDEAHRRKGVATYLVRTLQIAYPETEIDWGMQTDDGAKLYAALPKRVTNVEHVIADQKALAEKVAERDRLQGLFDAFYALEHPSDEDRARVVALSDPMNALHDEIYTLEYALRGARSTRTMIVTDAEIGVPCDPLAVFKERWRGHGVECSITQGRDGALSLSQLVVSKEQRKRGIGTHFMQELVALADAGAARINLSPSTDLGASSVSRLRAFYKRFGFVENKGRNKDFSISDTMYRAAHTAPDANASMAFDTFGDGESSSNVSDLSAVMALAKSCDSEVVLFRLSEASNAKFNGCAFDKMIWLRAESEQPLHVVFGHKLLHALRIGRPDLHSGLQEAIAPMLHSDAPYKDAHWLGQPGEPCAREAMTADLLGARFAEPSFWRLVAAHNPTMLKAVAAYVSDHIELAYAAFSGQDCRQTAIADHFVADLNKARDILAKTIAEYDADRDAAPVRKNGFFESFLPPRRAWAPQASDFDAKLVSTLLAENIDAELKDIYREVTGVEPNYEKVFDWLTGPALKSASPAVDSLLAVAARRGYVHPMPPPSRVTVDSLVRPDDVQRQGGRGKRQEHDSTVSEPRLDRNDDPGIY